jgi:arylsulfatase A-like enzyme
MTGQHTGHTPIRGNKSVEPEGQWPIEDATHTLAELLKQKGYATGGFGKWGLGGPGTEGDPIFQGFDVFFGYNCQGKAHNYYPRHLWDNQEKLVLHENEGTKEGIYAPNLIHEKALEFIETNKDKPFFLFYPNVIPHAELFAPEEYTERFRGKFLPEKEYQGYDEGPKFRDGPYGSQPESHAAFAAMVTLLDEQVGQVIDKIRELGLSENTLVIFTSDNGPHLEGGADPDYFNSNGIYTGYKRDLYEGGIRVPTIAWWPGKIAANTATDHLSAFWDVYPTVAELTGQEIHDSVDGISFLPTLLGKEGQQEHDYLYWEFHEKNGRQAIRKGDWKLVRYDVFSPEKITTELYNIAEDPSETMNVAKEKQEITEELLHLMQGARTESTVFTFN